MRRQSKILYYEEFVYNGKVIDDKYAEYLHKIMHYQIIELD